MINKKAQEKDLKTNHHVDFFVNKKAQEEMVGFVLIMIIVSVIMLIFLGFYLNKNSRDSVQSYEIQSFTSVMLQYTTDCENNFGRLEISDLIKECSKKNKCLDGRDSCSVMENEIKGVILSSWDYGLNRPVKGYKITLNSVEEDLPESERINKEIVEGETNGQYKSNLEEVSYGGRSFEIGLYIYYSD